MNASFLEKLINDLIDIGCALSSENDLDVLLTKIVDRARLFANADGGTLYLLSPDGQALDWAIVQNESMGVRKGGAGDAPLGDAFKSIALYDDAGKPVLNNVATYVAHKQEVVRIADVYDETDGFDFTGPIRFDEATGYRTQSMLVVPLAHFEGGVIGVLQLINAQDSERTKTLEFNERYESLLRSIASQAAVAIKNAELVKALELQFEAFIRSIAAAIDAKSPYTAGHVRRVVDITMRIAEAVSETEEGDYADVKFSTNDLKAMRIASWMHDIGKITTPEYVVDKATKLETIFDRLEIVRERLGRLEAEAKLAGYIARDAGDTAAVEASEATIKELKAAWEFIDRANAGKEFMRDEDVAEVERLLELGWISENEAYNLSIRKGTLTQEERQIIMDHARVSLDMLKALPFSKNLAEVPEIAASHHEKLNGKGYPRGLAAHQLDVKARILAVADIFEALTAADRPYKKPTPMSGVHRILGFMAKDGELDPGLLNFAMRSGVFDAYAVAEVTEAQRDLELIGAELFNVGAE